MILKGKLASLSWFLKIFNLPSKGLPQFTLTRGEFYNFTDPPVLLYATDLHISSATNMPKSSHQSV